MKPSFDKGRIENAKRKLDSRLVQDIQEVEPSLAKDEALSVRHDWGTQQAGGSPVAPMALFPQQHASVPKKILIASVAFFIVAAGISATLIFGGHNNISSDNIGIEISGPITVDGGKELALEVTVSNNNKIDLQLADLRIVFPEGTRKADNLGEELKRLTDPIGDLAAGQSVKKQVRSVLFGQQNEKKQILFEVEYRVAGSNAIFTKDKTLDVIVTSSPVSLTVSSLKEVNSKQDLEFTIDLVSNSSQILKGVIVRGDYGFGFTYTGADPKPFLGQNVWRIGDLQPGEKRSIRVRGRLEGQDGEDRAFHFSVGVQGAGDPKTMQPEFLSVAQTVSIKKPFVSLDLTLDGSSGQLLAATAGRPVRGEIAWANNLPTKVRNVKVVLKLSGMLIDKSSVKVTDGFYNSVDNTIVWDQKNTKAFIEMSPGDAGQLTFSFASIAQDIGALDQFKNAEISLEVGVQGSRTDGVDASEVLATPVTKKVRFASDLAALARSTRSVGVFSNTGPIPPKAETQSTYTIIWSLTNTTNTIDGVQAVATIPSYVTWLGNVNPPSENVAFDSTTGTITWSVGEVKSGVGFSSAPRQLQFQVSLVPSVSQVGSAPVLVNDLMVQGTDRYTGTPLQVSRPAVTTRINSDPTYVNGSETVVQ
ncbi:MAG: hypothetical protein AAB391_03570 [Patescibacteria group bacterium]